jgi:hypothetical protein
VRRESDRSFSRSSSLSLSSVYTNATRKPQPTTRGHTAVVDSSLFAIRALLSLLLCCVRCFWVWIFRIFRTRLDGRRILIPVTYSESKDTNGSRYGSRVTPIDPRCFCSALNSNYQYGTANPLMGRCNTVPYYRYNYVDMKYCIIKAFVECR